MTSRRDRHTLRMAFALSAILTWGILTQAAVSAVRDGRVAILKDTPPGMELTTADVVAEALRREGFEVEYLSADAVCDPAVLSAQKYFLYVVPNAKCYPAIGADTLVRYLQGKGNLMVLGTLPLDNPAWKCDGKWVDKAILREQIGTTSKPFPALADIAPTIETLFPTYKLYPLTDIASLKTVSTQGIVSEGLTLPVPAEAFSCYARPEGKGCERGYKWRWIPLVRACDKNGVERGTPVWILLHQTPLNEGQAFADAVRRLAAHANNAAELPSFEGSIVAVCAITDPAALKAMASTNLWGQMARRIRDGLFLSHAGSEHFSYWPGEQVRLGAAAMNRGTQPAAVQVRIRVYPKNAEDPVFQQESKLTLEPGQSGNVTFPWTPQSLAPQGYLVTTELLHNGKPIDVITHELGALSTEKPPRDAFVTVRNGDFWLEGKKWYPIGVNYWPRYAIALDCEDYVYHWLTPGFYNPEEVERDLAQLESLGATFVSIRAHAENDRRTLLDFLRRCRNHNIRVFLFAQTHVITDEPHYFQGIMMPTAFQEQASADFIRSARLADNPTLLGYDLIWEPAGWVFSDNVRMFGWQEPNYRRRWDRDWACWIVDRYGSLAHAEADWGMPAPRRDGQITSPSNEQLRVDGPWRVMVAAYRRFMDDLMSRKWNDAVRKLRSLDPNHLISFRQGNLPPHDFTLTATPKHVDFFCMEGYSFKPEPADTNAVGFVNRYIHFLTNGKPHFWAEFGANVWDRNSMSPSAQGIDRQAQVHEMIYRMAFQHGASGATPWWLAGGYRISERSDFGILNPDGTLRPSGRLLQEYARRFKTPRSYPEPDTWFTVDRDAHSGGQHYVVFNSGREAFEQAAAAGKTLGIRTPGTGTTSADAPLLAVGNTAYTGHNPPKYLNAEFNWFKIRIGGGDWIEVTQNARIRVPRNQPITAAASVGNLQEATWLTPEHCQGQPGAVFLATTSDSGLTFRLAIQGDTGYLADATFGASFLLTTGVSAETNVVLQMTADQRAWFGEKLRFTLEPIDGQGQ